MPESRGEEGGSGATGRSSACPVGFYKVTGSLFPTGLGHSPPGTTLYWLNLVTEKLLLSAVAEPFQSSGLRISSWSAGLRVLSQHNGL